MKILFINDYATDAGGAEISIFLLKDELEKRGHEVKLFASSARNGNQTLQTDSTCYGTLSFIRTYLQTANFSAYFQLKKLLNAWQPDVVHVSLFLTQLSPLILPLLKNYPTLWHLHWYRGICPIGTKRLPSGQNCEFEYGNACLSEKCLPFHQWLPLMRQMKYLEKHKSVFRRIVAGSNFVKTTFEKFGYENIDVIWYGIKQPPSFRFQDFNSKPVIVFAGRLVKEKGVDLLLKAFAEVLKKSPDALLKIAGEGREKKILKSLSAVLNIEKQVQFLGHLSQKNLDDNFADAWVQVVPSVWNEPFGLTVIEGMRRGTPVVAVKTGGISELIAHRETGLLTEAKEKEIADAILQLIDREDLRLRFRNNSSDFVRRYCNVGQYADNFLKIYRELI